VTPETPPYTTPEVNPLKQGAFAIVFDEKKRVLLCHRRDYDLWNLPGGGVLLGEKPEEGAIRETLEETGAQVRILKEGHHYYRPKQGNVVFTYVAETSDDVETSDESDDTRWFSLDELPYNLIPSHGRRIKDIIENQETTWKTEIDYSLPEIVHMVNQAV
jgi:8-oxo-dGTP pyrophosphatase MutT (NUDIX family)